MARTRRCIVDGCNARVLGRFSLCEVHVLEAKERLRNRPPGWRMERAPIERPIIFSGPMVRAILAGLKSQTRRVRLRRMAFVEVLPGGRKIPGEDLFETPSADLRPGDRLWVRETWHPRGQVSGGLIYAADNGDTPDWIGGEPVTGCRARWRSPIYMPRAACRLLLEVTEVRFQDLHEISDADCAAEGILGRETAPGRIAWAHSGHWATGPDGRMAVVATEMRDSPQGAFRSLWDSVSKHAGERWEHNPKIVAITFRRLA